MLQFLSEQGNFDILLPVVLLGLELLLKPCDLLLPGCRIEDAFLPLLRGFAQALLPLLRGFAQALLPLLRRRLGDGNADRDSGSLPESMASLARRKQTEHKHRGSA